MRCRRLLFLPLAALALVVLGCGEDTSSRDGDALARRFPAHADRILGASAAFVAGDEGFTVSTEDAVARRGELSAVLPRRGEEAARFELPSGLAIRVRERDLGGEGSAVGHAVSYARAGGTSYWTASPGEYEEWLALDPGVATGDHAVAIWDIEGGALREDAGVVEILDAAGEPRIRVTASEAYTAAGDRVEPRLVVRGSTLELWVDAGGAPVLVDPGWAATGSLTSQRAWHSATLLPSGKVMVAGGRFQTTSCFNVGGSHSVATAELYDPALGGWSSGGSMAAAREVHTATRLQNGKVLIAGGYFAGSCSTTDLASVELYDPAVNAWSAGPPLSVARASHSATLLASGKVLVAGGASPGVLASTEIYDPSANTWSPAAAMSAARYYHLALRLLDGRVFVVGGYDSVNVLTSAEIYDPGANAWSPAAPIGVARSYPAGVVLADGRVLVAGGYTVQNGNVIYLGTSALYDPATNTWSPGGSMSSPRAQHGLVLLADGRALTAGGVDSNPVPASEIYNPTTNAWTLGGAMPGPGSGMSLTLLQNGKALAAGGYINSASPTLKTAALFDPGAMLGVPCANDAACASGHCADGVCCNTACAGGACDACSIAAGAPQDGVCAQLTGTPCDDFNLCTQSDQCQSGACAGTPVACAPVDACHLAGTCNGATGTCSTPMAPDGTACTDGSACTQVDTCQSGVCAGGSPVICAPPDQCHLAGTCDAATGICAYPAQPDDTACDDGNACTPTERCTAGVCSGLTIKCFPLDECHAAGTCDPASGVCSNPPKNDGAPCSGGVCMGGTCTLASTSSSAGAGGSSASSSVGSSASGVGGSSVSSSASGVGGSSASSSASGVGGSSASSSASGVGGKGTSSSGAGVGGASSSATTSGVGGRMNGESSGSGSGGNPSENGGCGCGVVGAPSTGGISVGFALLLAARARGRRRARRSRQG